ncbi:MAG TPA: hypothetical protein VJJ21_02505 [Candidatus Nanoarchaeia archaeon]|nr:hypothetical protein [Candidatus Nanoarchaeia archaeon]
MDYKLLDNYVSKLTQDQEKFLNSLTTNELDKPVNAFLDKLGKLIVLVYQLKKKDAIYLSIPNKYEQQLNQHLQPYLRLSKVKMEKTNLKAVHIVPEKEEEEIGTLIIQQNIGYITLLENVDQLKHLKEVSEEEYKKIRLENNLPSQGIDFNNEMFLEVNIPEAISYTKGCYLGQEIIARVHHKSKPSKILTRILYPELPKDLKVTSHQEEIGAIKSSCYSEKFNGHLCFAKIKNDDKEIDDGERV